MSKISVTWYFSVRKILLAIFITCLPNMVSAQYRFDVWTTDNGLPQNSINGILQSRDGFIWFTTNDGIVRFDGVRFKVFDRSNTRGLINNRFNGGIEDASGRLWFRGEEESVVLYENGIFKTFDAESGLPTKKKIGLIYNDREGGILLSTAEGFYKYSDGRFLPVQIKSGNADSVISYIDNEGGIWLTDKTGLRRVVSDRVSYYGIKRSSPLFALSVFQDRSGNFWIGTSGKPIYRLYRGIWQEFSLTLNGDVNFAEDSLGNIWIGHKDGVVKIDSLAVQAPEPRNDELSTFTKKDGLSDDQVISITGDREGNVWVGTILRGLNQITRQSIRVFSGADWNSSDENVYPVLEDSDKNIWLGAWAKTLVKYSEEEFSTYQAPTNISSLFEDSQKRLWVGTLRGVYVFKDGQFTEMTGKVGLSPTSVVQTINEDRRNNLWFGTGNDGLIRFKDGKTTGFTTNEGLPENKITAFLELKDGKICAGTREGLAFFNDDQFTVLTEKDGLTSNYVRSLYEDNDGVLWIGTYDNGLSRYKDGKFTNYTVKNGLYSKNVFCILEDENGWFWMNSNTGIYRVSRRELEDFAAGKIKQITSIAYNIRDGLKNAEGNGEKHPAGIRRENGELWFPTLQGVAVVDPSEVTLNDLPPPVHFDDILIDGEIIGNYRDQVVLKPEQKNIEITYTGLSFVNPNLVKFRYRLEGFEKNWNEAGTRRSAYYNYLPPGEYTFQLQAANRDGVWNTEGKFLKIIVQPLFYETWWFTILVSLCIIGVILWIYFYRVSQLKKIAFAKTVFAKQLIASQEAERKRIAGELHDGLGQSLVIIKNRAILGAEDKDLQEFEEISNTATNALGEVREIIYDLRPQHLERIGLTKAIRAMLKRVAGIIEIHENIDSIDGLFPENIEINVYRIVQECVNNIIKHSEATRADVTIKQIKNKVIITVEDDGKGFDIEKVKEKRGGFGLIGLKERVRLLNGNFEVNSEVGFGTTVLISFSVQKK